MATVPEYRRQVQLRPGHQQQIGVNTSAETFGAGVGRAVQSVGKGLGDVAAALDYKDQLTQDAEAKEAFNRYRYSHREAMKAPETGYLNRTGRNAQGVQGAAEDTMRSLREQHGAKLAPRARKKYEDLVDGLQDQAHGQLLNHTSQENRNYIVNQRQSTIEGFLEEAASNWNDEEVYQQNLGAALAEQNQLATLQGWDEATRKESAEKLISGSMRNRITMAAVEDPIAAQAMLEQSREVLNSDDEYALDNALEEEVRAAKVNILVGKHVKRGGTGVSGGTDPYGTAVRRAESRGNPQARNSRSTAYGTHQFLGGTYLDEVRKLRAAGGAAWAEGMTEQEILATRGDVAYEQEVFEFFRAGNQQQIAAAGYSVTPTTEYIWHHFGDAGGPGLMRAVKTDPSAPPEAAFGVATPGILKANPHLKGKTVGEIYDWAASHIGDDGTTRGGGNFFDYNAAMQEALAIQDPELQAAALAKISGIMSMQDKARTANRTQAQEAAWEMYVQTGDSNLPMEMKQAMGQGGWTAFQSAVQNDMEGIDVTEPETWDRLTTAMSNDREMAEINLEALRPKLSKSDYRHFYEAREAARTSVEQGPFKKAEAEAAIPYAKIYGYAEPAYEAMVGKKSDDPEKHMQFQRQLSTLVSEFFNRENRVPTEPEVSSMAAALLLPVEPSDTGWLFGREGSGSSMFQMANRPNDVTFEVSLKYDDVPYADRARIASQIAAAGGNPTPEAVTDAYEMEVLMRAGIPPVVEMGDVPEGFTNALRKRNPNLTDTELMEEYQLFLMDQFKDQR